jgi:hypothetical protein
MSTRRRVGRDLEGHVHSLALGPLVDEPHRVGVHPDHLEARPAQMLDPVRVDLAHDDARAAVA